MFHPTLRTFQRGALGVAAVGLLTGSLAACGNDGDSADAVARMRELLGDVRLRERLRAACWAMVDGRGPARVADALLALDRAPRPGPS